MRSGCPGSGFIAWAVGLRGGRSSFSPALAACWSVLLFCAAGARAEEILFITVSSPAVHPSSTEDQTKEASPFITTSRPALQPPPPTPAPASTPAAVPPPDLEKKELRDPFWPVGFFPPGWNRPAELDDGRRPDAEEAGWGAAATKIQISGTSQMAGRTAAIVNGDLKLPGDRIEVKHEGATYGWRISAIESDGRIQLRRDGVN